MERISVKQLMMLMVVGLMSPLIRILPGRATALGGEMGWLGPLFAGIPAVLTAAAACDLLRHPGEDLTDAVFRAMGKGPGRVLCVLLGFWLAGLGSLVLRIFGERFLSTTYTGQPVQLFIFLLLIVVYYAAHRRLSDLARAGQIFFWLFAALLAVVFALCAMSVETANLTPFSVLGLPAALRAAEPMLSVLGGGVSVMLLTRHLVRRETEHRSVLLAVIGTAVMGAAVVLVTEGAFGPRLVQRLTVPFFMLIKEIRIANTFERMESVVITLWTITDFVLITLMVKGAARAFGRALGAEEDTGCVTPVILMMLVGSALVVPDAIVIEGVVERVATIVNIVVGFGFIPIIWCLTKIRKKD